MELPASYGLSPVRNVIPGKYRTNGTGQGGFDIIKHTVDGLEEPYMAQVREETPGTGTMTVKKTVWKGSASHTETEGESHKASKGKI